MLTETHGVEATKLQIFIYSIILSIPSILISFSSIGGLIYLSLASDGQPSVESRHAPNPPDRDLDIYVFTLSNRSLHKIVDSPVSNGESVRRAALTALIKGHAERRKL